MENQSNLDRTLAYTSASVVDLESLEKVSGGTSENGETVFTTKLTVQRYGGDVGIDGTW